jgi:hypothetical protein
MLKANGFVSFTHFRPSLIFKELALSVVALRDSQHTGVNDKRNCLLYNGVNYDRKEFYRDYK